MEPTIEQNANVERPRSVTKAVQFLASALAIGLLNAIFTLAQRTIRHSNACRADHSDRVFFGLLFFLVMKISAGRNWARIIWLILVLLTSLSRSWLIRKL